MKNPTRPDSSPIRVEHTQWDPKAYHAPHRKKREKSVVKPVGRDEFGFPNMVSADHPSGNSTREFPVVEEDKGITEALKKDLSDKGL